MVININQIFSVSDLGRCGTAERNKKMQEIEILNHIHQNADMARDSLNHILDLSHSADFTQAVQSQIKEYQGACDLSEQMLEARGEKSENARMMPKMMADITSWMRALKDPTDSQLAEMVIEGSTMGITKLTRQIHDYTGDDKEVLSFAKDQVKREQDNIEKMKTFL